jgi:hypothetical protein
MYPSALLTELHLSTKILYVIVVKIKIVCQPSLVIQFEGVTASWQ